ncbi:MAG: hypothetical protein GX589_03465 [Deltaproteobacteria bacterium]|nr:hypothetical protein [Deltaproteobacteria bacterium]
MQFRKNELPRYVYCTKTVTTELKLEDKKLSDAQYFKARYGAESNPKKSVAELISLIKAIKAKHIDVFASANIAVKSEPSAPTKNTKSRSSTRRKR